MAFLKNLAQKIIINPVKNNFTLALVILGIAIIVTGMHFDSEPKLGLMKSFTNSISKVGVAILGAGVFAVILKSAQFIDVFQKHILDVFYKPVKIASVSDLRIKWLTLTDVILKNTLPASHCEASQKIMGQFIDEELEYHFEKYLVTYDIDVIKPTSKSPKLKIKHSISTEIVISPNHNDPVFEQSITTNNDGSTVLKSLIVNNDVISTKDRMQPSSENPQVLEFKLNLNEILSKGSSGSIKMERVYEINQDLSSEPYIIATNIRYVKGFVVRAKVTKGFKIYFRKTGIDAFDTIKSIEVDGGGYKRWALAEPNTLILPGEGYIIIVVKENN